MQNVPCDVIFLWFHCPTIRCDRTWSNPAHKGVPACGTDTDDTEDDRKIGGLGILSHSRIALTHQHWIMQLLCAGGFNVTCTEGSEASHKTNMRLASVRVQHRRPDVTQRNMHEFLKKQLLFEDVQFLHDSTRPQRSCKNSRPPRVHPAIALPLTSRGSRLSMGNNELQLVSSQKRFLHRRVRLATVELMDLFCDKLKAPKTQDTYNVFNSLCWSFGQRLVMPKGTSFWATDDGYFNSVNTARGARHDVLVLKGTESVTVDSGGEQHNALCCLAECFIVISNLHGKELRSRFSLLPIKDEISPDRNGSITYILARWLSPHNTAVMRDPQCRPICPGPLWFNHCLWSYAVSKRPRKMMVDSRGKPSTSFTQAGEIFGKDTTTRTSIWQSEKNAYYALIAPSSVVTTANISREYKESSMEFSEVWLQTITNT